MKEFYVDCSGWFKIKAENEEDAKEKFWSFIDKFEDEFDILIYADVEGVEPVEDYDHGNFCG